MSLEKKEKFIANFIIDRLKKDQRKMYRVEETPKAFHAKTHVVLDAEFVIPINLPPDFQCGIFATPQTIPCKLRYSSASSTITSDLKTSVTGLAVQLQHDNGDAMGLGFTLQSMKTFPLGTPNVAYDIFFWITFTRFIMINMFFVGIVFLFKGNIMRLWELKKALKVHSSLNFTSFYSTTPYAFGNDRVVKYRIRPMKYQLPLDVLQDENRLTHEMHAYYEQETSRFEFGVQLQQDKKLMPTEDASVEWEEDVEKGGMCFFPIAYINIKSQVVEESSKIDWGKLARFEVDVEKFPEHIPLGGINRLRQLIYQEMHDFHVESLNDGVV